MLSVGVDLVPRAAAAANGGATGRMVREVVARRVEGAGGLAVLGARQVVHKTGRITSAARRVEAGPRRRRYDGEEYCLPHLKFSDRLRLVLTDCDAERHIERQKSGRSPPRYAMPLYLSKQTTGNV